MAGDPHGPLICENPVTSRILLVVSPDAFRDLQFRHLRTPEEFRRAEEVQVAAWGMTEEHPVPISIQRAMEDNSGLLLGAWAGDRLAGVCLGFLARDGAELYHYSHMTAVRPEYQNHHLGFRLKAYQREEVLNQGLSQVRWTFDPLQSKNAFLNVRRLGAVPEEYRVDYYGPMGSDVNRGLETDRLRVNWDLVSPRVKGRIEGRYPSEEQDAASWSASQPIVGTEPAGGRLRRPTAVSEPSQPRVTIEIPFDLGSVREHDPECVRPWRQTTREAFRLALSAGYRVEDFAVVSRDDERRSFYFLTLRDPEPSGEGSPASEVP